MIDICIVSLLVVIFIYCIAIYRKAYKIAVLVNDLFKEEDVEPDGENATNV